MKPEFDFDATVFEESVPLHGYFMRVKARSIRRTLPAGLTALDIGCGSGAMEALVHDHFASLIGIDPTPKQIERAKARGLSNCEFAVESGTRLRFEDGRFDAVLIVNVLHHVPAPEQPELLGEIRRVLKPGGRVLVYEHNPLHPLVWLRFYHFSEVDRGARMIGPVTLRRELRRAGFGGLRTRFLLAEALGEYYGLGTR